MCWHLSYGLCVCLPPPSSSPQCPGRRWPALWGAAGPGDQQDIRAQREPGGLRRGVWPPQHHVQHGLHSDPGELHRPLQPADDELHQGDDLLCPQRSHKTFSNFWRGKVVWCLRTANFQVIVCVLISQRSPLRSLRRGPLRQCLFI